MAGVSDAALRLICKELGAGYVVTEFTNVNAVVARENDIKQFVEFSEKERPLGVQLFGSDLEKLELAVKIVDKHFDVIDYNMGCPSRQITQQMACSALLQEPNLTRKIFRIMVENATKPVTVKIRAGVDKPDKFLEIGEIAEEEGLQMITLHGRTVKQGYSGKSDWGMIKKLKESLSIPVCGNGDIHTPEDAKKMLDDTGCDYVMVGRAAAQNPFLFTQINSYLKTGKYPATSSRAKVKTFLKYLDLAKNYKTITSSNIRFQAMNLAKGCTGSRELRGKLMGLQNIEDIKKVMEKFLASL